MTALLPEAIQFPTAFGRARAGDRDAFAELAGHNEAMVYSLAWNFVGDRSRGRHGCGWVRTPGRQEPGNMLIRF